MEDDELDIEFSDIEFDADIDADDADLDIEDPLSEWVETRYVKPHKIKSKKSQVTYAHAVKLARALHLGKGERYDVIVSGDFVFGDLLEAYLTEKNIKCRKLTITTLSLSQGNVDSLRNLLEGGYVDELNLIVSHYFFTNEKGRLIPYIYQELDIDNKLQMAVASIHTKTIQFETAEGDKVVMHGSANLRTNGNLEQVTIEENEEIYDFYDAAFGKILERFSTINKAVRRGIFDLIKI